MAKFHINTKTGEPGKCSATNGKCPFGGADEHFTSLAAARVASEAQLSEANGWEASKKEAEKLSPAVEALMADIAQLENNPARHHYGFPEDEMVRYNIDQAIAEKKAKLRELLPHADFTQLRNTITNEDRAYGVEFAAIRLGNTDKRYSWDNIMGADTRRTANAIERYERIRNGSASALPEAQADIENFAKKHRDQEVFARAFENKYEIPEQYEQAFEKAWTDPKRGERHFKSELKRLENEKTEYAAGRLSATKVVGTGLRNPKAAADDYFKKRERELTRALKTKGRSDTVTVSNVMYQARQENWPQAR